MALRTKNNRLPSRGDGWSGVWGTVGARETENDRDRERMRDRQRQRQREIERQGQRERERCRMRKRGKADTERKRRTDGGQADRHRDPGAQSGFPRVAGPRALPPAACHAGVMHYPPAPSRTVGRSSELSLWGWVAPWDPKSHQSPPRSSELGPVSGCLLCGGNSAGAGRSRRSPGCQGRGLGPGPRSSSPLPCHLRS